MEIDLNTVKIEIKEREESAANSSPKDSSGQNRVVEWTRPAISALMDGYRNHPCLYDTKHKHYYNKQARREALADVLSRVRAERSETTVSECQKKFQSLRSYYVQELRKMRKSLETKEHDQYRSCVWWFNQIEFLREHVQVRKSEPNYLNQSCGMGDNLEGCEVVVPSCNLGPTDDEFENSPKRHCSSPRLPELGRDSGYSTFSRDVYQTTQGEVLGSFVASQMNAIQDEQLYIITQSRITQIIAEARLKQLEIKLATNEYQLQNTVDNQPTA